MNSNRFQPVSCGYIPQKACCSLQLHVYFLVLVRNSNSMLPLPLGFPISQLLTDMHTQYKREINNTIYIYIYIHTYIYVCVCVCIPLWQFAFQAFLLTLTENRFLKIVKYVDLKPIDYQIFFYLEMCLLTQDQQRIAVQSLQTWSESESHLVVSDSVTPGTIQSVKFSRPEYLGAQVVPSPGDLPNPRI